MGDVGPDEAVLYGPEVDALVRLREAGLPLAGGWLVRLTDDSEARIAAALERALAEAEVARLRPALPSGEAAERWDRNMGVPRDVRSADDARAHARELIERLRGTFGAGLMAWAVRVVGCHAHPCGRAVSADTSQGDPDELGVWAREEPAARWRVDRRTMRATERGGGVSAGEACSIADLADRAQLVLGRPVEIEWCRSGDRFAIVGLRFIALPARFGVHAYRRVALVAADEGTVAPLAVDALDRALGGSEAGHPAVRRVFARPYRRMGEGVPRFRHAASAPVVRAGARAARVASDVAAPLAAARSFHAAVREQVARLDVTPLETLDDRLLIEAIRERHVLVSDAFALLDRGREATGAVLGALEATVGPLGRDAIGAIAAPRPTRWRQGIERRLARLGKDIKAAHGRLVGADELGGPLRRAWSQMRRELADVRPLGIDVWPDAMGAGEGELSAAVAQAMDRGPFPSDGERSRVARRIRADVRARPLGRAREALAGTLLLLLGRVAHAKGAAADDLAAALLRLRRAALVAGARLVDRGILEAADDVLRLDLAEIEQALSGEPGAYAARARLRREDDARWAHYEAPWRLVGRKG
ncbi:MAG: hypothetical protein ACOC97_00885 [Myxococcota bacterium]